MGNCTIPQLEQVQLQNRRAGLPITQSNLLLTQPKLPTNDQTPSFILEKLNSLLTKTTKLMKKILVFVMILGFASQWAHSQGCITMRNITGFGQYNLFSRTYVQSDWQLSIANRFFVANKAYAGSEFASSSLFENRTYTVDIGVTRFLSKGWSITLGIPITSNSRTFAAEHGGPGDNTTRSFGLNDMRIEVYKWILKPSENQKFNFQLGLGLKLPTGNYSYTDFFHRNDSTTVLAPVSTSIQLGDGGTGIITELNAFYVFSRTWSLYGNFYYMFNPRDQNGVSTLQGRDPTPEQTRALATVTSVPDNFSLRAGVSATIKDWIFSAGLRYDGVPVYDVLGESHGARKAGHNLSVEPGIMYNLKTVSLYYYMPFTIAVNEKATTVDKSFGETTGFGGSPDLQFIFGALFRL